MGGAVAGAWVLGLMRGGGLKSKKGLRSAGSLVRSAMKPAKKKPKQIGARKQREIDATAEWRKAYLAEGDTCEIGAVLRAHNVQGFECWGTPQGLHERVKRSAAGGDAEHLHHLLTYPPNLMRACNPCNLFVEDNPPLAKRLGLTVDDGTDPADVPIGS